MTSSGLCLPSARSSLYWSFCFNFSPGFRLRPCRQATRACSLSFNFSRAIARLLYPTALAGSASTHCWYSFTASAYRPPRKCSLPLCLCWSKSIFITFLGHPSIYSSAAYQMPSNYLFFLLFLRFLLLSSQNFRNSSENVDGSSILWSGHFHIFLLFIFHFFFHFFIVFVQGSVSIYIVYITWHFPLNSPDCQL